MQCLPVTGQRLFMGNINELRPTFNFIFEAKEYLTGEGASRSHSRAAGCSSSHNREASSFNQNIRT